jgi:predicted transcriptional regulator
MLLHEVTGRQLRDARQALGFSLSRLAVRAGINRVCIRIYESHWTMRRTRTLMRLAA